MRLDAWLSVNDARATERHVTRVHASPATVYQSLWQTDFGGPIARARRKQLTLDTFIASGFIVLEAVPDEELVPGLAGRFWTPGGGLAMTRPETFRSGPRTGEAQAAWNFHCRQMDVGWTELSTETRVRVDPDAAPVRRTAERVVAECPAATSPRMN